MTTQFIGTGFPTTVDYGNEERDCWKLILNQINDKFAGEQNLLISLTWFGPQFDNDGWQNLLEFESNNIKFDNLFLLATVDPPYLTVNEIQEVKNKIDAIKVFYLGNFDSPHGFNFFAPVISKNFKKYSNEELILTQIEKNYVNYNRKPKSHRVKLVKEILANGLESVGTLTLGRDQTHVHDNDANNNMYISIGEKHETYLELGNRPNVWEFGIPQDYYSLHNMDIWKKTFLYINAATESNPINDLFCQQDTFKPMIGLRPFVINGVQRTYRWLRNNGFKTFNHYWNHVDIENGNVIDTIVQLIRHLQSLTPNELLAMYNDMLPNLYYNKNRFFEFAQEQKYKIENLF